MRRKRLRWSSSLIEDLLSIRQAASSFLTATVRRRGAISCWAEVEEDEPLAYQMSQYRRSNLSYNYITSAKLASDIPEADRPAYEVMDTASAEWDALKTSKRDYSAIPAFIAPPLNKLDICSLPVPARKVSE